MITDLERIGDQAGDIAEIIKTTDLLEPVKATRLGEMAKAVASMVRESIESFANEDLKKTKEVIAYDDVIDDMFSTFLFNFQIIFSNFSVLIPVSEFFSFYRCSSSSLFLCTPVIAYSAHSAIFVAWSPMRS